MNELRTLLEHKADEMRIRTEPPAVLLRRARARRGRTAGLAAVVAAALLAGALTGARILLDAPEPPQPAVGMHDGARPVWPSAEDVRAIADMNTRGHATWARSPGRFGATFAERVLRWNPRHITAEVLRSDPPMVSVSNVPLAEAAGLDPAPQTVLTLTRLGEDGPYFATAIRSDAVKVHSPAPGARVTPRLSLMAQLPPSSDTLQYAWGLHGPRLGVAPFQGTYQHHDPTLSAEIETFSGARVLTVEVQNQNRVPLAMTAVPLANGPVLAVVPEPTEAPRADQYRFDTVVVQQGDEPGRALIYFTFDFEEYPGVHECTWRALGADGSVIGTRTMMFAQTRPSTTIDNQGLPEHVLDLAVEGGAEAGQITCGPRRLDTPNISTTEPYPAGLDRDGAAQVIEDRVLEWAARLEVDSMDPHLAAANIVALEQAAAQLGERLSGRSGPAWLEVEELHARATYLRRGEPVRVRLDRV
jgi:hypothetical protein